MLERKILYECPSLFIDTGYDSIVRLLFERGIKNINAVNQGNNSALMFAIMGGNR